MRKIIVLIITLLCISFLFTSCKTKNSEPEIDIQTVETSPFKTVRTIYGPRGANRKFFWDIVKSDGSIDSFEVKTNEKAVGPALSKVALAKFEENEDGETVISVSGYELEEGMKWAFYINGELSDTVPDSTEIKSGSVYSFRQIKAK